MSRLVIRNRSAYPTDEVRRLVRFALDETDGRGVCVNVKNAHDRSISGVAYQGVPTVSDAPRSSEYLITIRIGSPERFPTTWPRRYERSPDMGAYADWREALVAVVAHEGRHITQYRERLRGRGEVDAETHEAWMLRRYRREVAEPARVLAS